MRCAARDSLRLAHTGEKDDDDDQGEEIGPLLELLESRGERERLNRCKHILYKEKNVSATRLSFASLAGEAVAGVYEQAGWKHPKNSKLSVPSLHSLSHSVFNGIFMRTKDTNKKHRSAFPHCQTWQRQRGDRCIQ